MSDDFKLETFKMPKELHRYYKLLAAQNYKNGVTPDKIGHLYIKALEYYKENNPLE